MAMAGQAPLQVAKSMRQGGRPASEAIPLTVEQDYREARVALLKYGWRPMITYFVDHQGDLERTSGVAGEFLKLGMTEVQLCEGADHLTCFFDFEKDGQCLQVVTDEEYIPELNQFPVVLSWRHHCPSAEDG